MMMMMKMNVGPKNVNRFKQKKNEEKKIISADVKPMVWIDP